MEQGVSFSSEALRLFYLLTPELPKRGPLSQRERNPCRDTYVIDDRLSGLSPHVRLEACGIISHLRPRYASNLHSRPHYGSNGA